MDFESAAAFLAEFNGMIEGMIETALKRMLQ